MKNKLKDVHTRNEITGDVILQQGAIIGLVYQDDCGTTSLTGPSTIRSGTVIYADVKAGQYFQTGHNALIREFTEIGDHVVIGTNTVIEGHCKIGNFVKIESNCFIPTYTSIGNRVFLGPNVVMTNDKYPLRMRDSYHPKGPVINDNVSLGAGAIILPDVEIGEGSFVAAGAVVTHDVEPFSLVYGTPAIQEPLTDKLREDNMALSWRDFID